MCSCLSCDRIKFCIAEYFTASWKPHAGLLTHASKNVAESIVSEYYWNSKEVTEMILMSMNVFLSQLFLLSSCFWILNRQIWHTACDWWSAWHIPGRQQGTLVLYKMYFTLEVLIHVYIWMCTCVCKLSQNTMNYAWWLKLGRITNMGIHSLSVILGEKQNVLEASKRLETTPPLMLLKIWTRIRYWLITL